MRGAGDGGEIAVDGDAGAHAQHFAGMQVTILEDRLADARNAFCLRGESHELSLHIRSETGIFFGGNVSGFKFFWAAHAQIAFSLAGNFHAALLQLFDDGAKMGRLAVREQKIATRDGTGDEKRASFDAVWNDGVFS